MIGFPLGILYANALEWGLHRFVLHGLGRSKQSTFAFHWHEHHRTSRKHGMRDAAYEEPLSLGAGVGNAQNKEALLLVGMGLLHAPLAFVAPWFAAALAVSGVTYYHVHKRSHLDGAWAKRHLRWHFDHHMGGDQDANYCVTFPLMDYVMGTRKTHVPTAEREPREPVHKTEASALR